LQADDRGAVVERAFFERFKRAINRHAQAKQLFDYALINWAPPSPKMKAKYALEGANQIVADLDAIERLGVIPVQGDYLIEDTVVRHATDRLAKDLLGLVFSPAKPSKIAHGRSTIA